MKKSGCLLLLCMCRYYAIAITVLFVTMLSPNAGAEAPTGSIQFLRLLTEQGYSVGSVEAIYQDKQGYIWFGGLEGLIRYDGYNFVSYHNAPNNERSISSNVVWDIREDKQGKLWVATDAGLNQFARDTEDFTRFQHDAKNPNTICSDATRSIAEDAEGNLWIATFAGLAKLDSSRTHISNFYTEPNNSNSLSSNELRRVFVDSAGLLWIGHNTAGLNRFDPKSNQFKRYPYEVNASVGHVINSTGTSHSAIVSIYQDKEGDLWLGTDGGGLNRFNEASNQFEHFLADPDNPKALSHKTVTAIAENEQGLWLATEGGLNLFNRKTREFSRYVHSPSDKSSLASSVIRSLLIDANHDLWVGNFPAGVNFLDTSNLAFKTYRSDPNNPNSLNQASVLALEEDENEVLWLGTDGGGLNSFDHEKNLYTHYPHNAKDPFSISAGAVLNVKRDIDGSFWLGTWRGGLNHFDPKTGHVKVYTTDPKNPGAITSENVWSVYIDREQRLWLATIGGGLNKLDRKTQTFSNYHHQFPSGTPFDVVWSIFQDHSGQLWLGTGEGLARYVPEADHFEFYKHDAADPDSLSFNVILDMAEDKNRNLWLATRGGGLNMFNQTTGKFTKITTKDGLASDVINSLKIDNSGNLWLGLPNGLSRFNPVTREITLYTEKNGLQGNQFNMGSALKTRKGDMVFGGTTGFTVFNPADIKPNQYIPPVAIVDFQIFNRPVSLGVEGSPLAKVISQTDAITLHYDQSVFSFSFVAMSYRDVDKNKFAYMMEGFERDWNYVGGNRRNATYTNLNPGTYVFRVKATNNQGVWNEKGRSIILHILPPPWKTWWAYTIYALLIVGALFLFVRSQHKKVLDERSLNIRLQQLDKLKDEFLANTSHELRTPLNGIIGLAESLVDGVGGIQTETSKTNLEMIISSGQRLERLVNEILDFSKLKEHSLTLYQKALDLHALTHVVSALLQPGMAAKNLQFNNAISKTVPLVYADEDRVQQILHNLIGNAIKFTSEGTISISAEVVNNQLEICVSDTGIGISEEQLPYVFDSFHQVEGSAGRHYAGTGLGLAVTKQLVELHGGKIYAKSTLKQGTKLFFTLPLLSANDSTQILHKSEEARISRVSAKFKTIEKSDNNEIISESAAKQQQKNHQEEELAKKRHEHFHILVVDDEPVNRQVLINHLSLQRYRVTSANGGKEALEIINKEKIDLVLLDIMMPSMSGYEVCKEMRETFSSHELPIIFLTAKTQINDLVTGFAQGANDFLTKPISRDELIARVKTHLELLEITRELEKKVQERTAELETKHHQLEEAYVQLEAISLSDPLTGLSNRRYLQKLIPIDIAKILRAHNEKMYKNAEKTVTDLTFYVLDVDFFKLVNDHYGHLAGDQLLIQLSDLLMTICRESDSVVRWGGEEFLVVSRDSSRNEAPLMAERIRQAVASCQFVLPDGSILHKTCSIGFACYPFIEDQPTVLSWEQVIDTADRALYAAKKSGRNQCVGLTFNAATPHELLHQRINEDLVKLIEEKKIEVIANNKATLVWV